MDIIQSKEAVNTKLAVAQQELSVLGEKQQDIEKQLAKLLKEKVRYDALNKVIENLDRLAAVGGEELFWGEVGDEQEARNHLAQVHQRIATFEGELEAMQQALSECRTAIQASEHEIHDYNEQNQILLEVEEAALDEYVIEREHEGFQYRPPLMPWSVHGGDEKRYRKILLIILLITFLLGYLIPIWQSPVVDRDAKIVIPERLAKLLLEKKPPPPPPPKVEEVKEEKKEEVKKEKKKEVQEKPQPTKKEVAVARKKAESSGVLAFKKDFAGLLDLDSDLDSKLGAQASLSASGATAKKSSRSIITTQAGSGSSGINTAALSKNVGGTGNSIEGVGFSRVESSIGTGYATEDRPLSEGPGPSRTDEEIQIVFDRYKSALYRIYNRELRKDPTLQGKMVLRLTIEPDGKVSACSVDSSDMDSPSMDKKMIARVKKFNFGVKEGVPTITILFPVDFLPAN